MNATQSHLLAKLVDIIEKYIDDPQVKNRIKAEVEPSKVKFVLHEIDIRKTREFSDEDQKFIKDIFFNFC